MANLQLTKSPSGPAFSIPEGHVINVLASGTGSLILYVNELDGQRNYVTVDESPAFIASQSETLIPVTENSSGATEYISTGRILTIDLTAVPVNFRYDNAGQAPLKVSVSETAVELQTLIYENNNQPVYLFDDVTDAPDTIKLVAALGDLTSTFVVGTRFTVFGSSTASMNTIWEVDSVAFAGGKTVITPTVTPETGASNTGSLVIQF